MARDIARGGSCSPTACFVYRSQEDEGKASRGSINMGVAQIVTSASDKLKFEVNNKLGKVSHHSSSRAAPSRVMRWVDALKQNVAYAKELSNTVSQTPSRAPSIAPSVGGGSLETRISTLDPDGAGMDSQGELCTTATDRFSMMKRNSHAGGVDPTARRDFARGRGGSCERNVVFDEVRKAIVGSLGTLESALDEYIDVVNLRERFFENMKELAAQHAAIERNCTRRLETAPDESARCKRFGANLLSSPPMSPIAGTPIDTNPGSKALQVDTQSLATATAANAAAMSSPRNARGRSTTMHTLKPQELEDLVDSALAGEAGEDDSALSDDSDEFFEAIESGQIPVDNDDDDKSAPTAPEAEALTTAHHHRQSAAVSLWHSQRLHCKDLTKISFPVFFNEPTSMLQRMAEDVEFSDVLDHAAAQEDATRRIAFVAAFAMSNYSSTIGRIAKPFNPMLGETFEFADLSKNACIAQSATWDYYGDVDAKSKFMGKVSRSAQLVLLMPTKDTSGVGAELPASTTPGLVEEHYSWTKVTTSLTFKPRGWRSSGAAEVKGKVMDKDGKEFWDLAGKWSSQLVARRVAPAQVILRPTQLCPTNKDGDVSPEYIRLWKNSEKPNPPLPFNLTPWAVQLNDDNAKLRRWLPPTDCAFVLTNTRSRMASSSGPTISNLNWRTINAPRAASVSKVNVHRTQRVGSDEVRTKTRGVVLGARQDK
ncbi:BQ5605_C108g13202 [Microbotryum silenes-dioicae]|uniref:BQ5605_C108g13202 protein n=1 Tax=Microbotryum silenes-dioicae TaxID=796604 RepID=A0A2X0MM97_9BASI|nr:BQ5605_C108g13202 [Microbotryum silenes-dioicae]